MESAMERSRLTDSVWLILLALAGNLVPGGLFMYSLLNDYPSLAAAFSDRLALAFFIDLAISTLLLAWLLAQKPLGPVKWPWFVFLSFFGTLAFAIPLFLWLNWRRAPDPRPNFRDWWRAV